MLRFLSLFLLLAASAPAQFLSFEMEFTDSGCVPCTESMQSRLERIRGVESASIDLEKGLIHLDLAESNRIRLGPLRARVTQDGTKIQEMRFTAKGVVEERNGTEVFVPAGLNSAFPVDGEVDLGPADLAGRVIQDGPGFRLEVSH